MKKIAIKNLFENNRIREELLRYNDSYFNWRGASVPFHELMKVRKDLLVSSLIESRIAGIFSLNYSWKADGVSENVANFCREIIEEKQMNEIVRGAFDAILLGFVPAFIQWESKNGLVVPSKIYFASPKNWEYSSKYGETGAIRYNDLRTEIILSEENKYNIIPVIRNRSDIFPLGEGIIEKLFWHVQYKIAGLEFWTQFAQKYGSPYIVGEVDDTLEDKDKSVLENLLAKIKGLGWALLPKGVQIKILEAMGKGASSDVFKNLLQFCREDITLAVLGHTGAAVSTAGKLGGENTAMEVRADIAVSDARIIEEFINTLVKYAVEINFGNQSAPRFEFYVSKSGRDIAERDEILYKTGLRLKPEYFSDTYGINIKYIDMQNQAMVQFAEKEELSQKNEHKLPSDVDELVAQILKYAFLRGDDEQ